LNNTELVFRRNQLFGNPSTEKPVECNENNWQINLFAQNSISKDALFYFGVNQNATAGFDNLFDFAKPPLLPNDSALEIYFKRSNWNNLFNKYLSDIRNSNFSSQSEWDFEFSSVKIENSSINWINLQSQIPASVFNAYDFILQDISNNATINMKNQTSYNFLHNGTVTNFKVIAKITSSNDEKIILFDYALEQNYPNPFNPNTIIEYSLKDKEFVTLKIFDVLGNEVTTLVNEEKSAGRYRVDFNASGLSTGVYFYKITAGSFSATRKMIILR
jgi:hypothetical protein